MQKKKTVNVNKNYTEGCKLCKNYKKYQSPTKSFFDCAKIYLKKTYPHIKSIQKGATFAETTKTANI
jgi:hypothetical protein